MSSPLPTLAERRPRLSAAEAETLARDRYRVAGTARPLPSDRDQNFLLEVDGHPTFVLKIADAVEERAVLEAQQAVLQHLAGADLPVPRLCTTTEGETLTTTTGDGGQEHLVRLLTYVPGVPLAEVRPHTPALLRGLGRMLGRMSSALAGFDHPGARRPLAWDLQQASETVRARLEYVTDPERRALVEGFLAHFEEHAAARLSGLRRGVIHGDANDYNVLVSAPTEPERSVVGLIDFGDLVHSYVAGEAAVAAAYAMLGARDPLAAAGDVAAGYHEAYGFQEEELAVLFPLICMRLCISVCTSAYARRLEPENAYLSISEAPAWALLERLARVHPRRAHYRLRADCGLAPCPHSAAVAAWLNAHAEEAAPVVRPAPHEAPSLVFDFSVGSTEWGGRDLRNPMALTDALFARLAAEGAALGVGRYDEARLVYTAEQFRRGPDEEAERRTIHLGIDLFLPAGTPVYAPFEGTVHSFADNARPLDYGPTLLLAHRPEGAPPFYTLYGHLSAASLEGLHEGQPVAQGQPIGTLGTSGENGGWAPHLHFQIITDLLGARGDFPGVAPPSERALWRSLCPDPNLLLRIPADRFPPPPPGREALMAARQRHVGPSLSLSYREPLHLVRGYGQHLYDAEGRAYLDAVNNVPHVGHSHPRVVEAAQRQMTVLNTNTRYLHEHLVRYAERLTATLPEPLRVCFFVNSGSEANDLALRLAYAHTGARDVIVLEGAYHGNLSSLIAVSPYKFDGPGGGGRPPHTHVVPMPDPYRGRYRASDPEAGPKYAAHVREAAARARERGGAAAFLAEPLLGCGGQIEPPEGFLEVAYRHVRAAGGVCISDEVQVGFGRVGTHFWGFEIQGVVPDIVTMGKPIGNGHPLGAVVTTPEVAASFAGGMEYFNTFGGNPVSCAVGLAVLDVIEEEGLQAHARRVGSGLLEGLRALQERHPIVGDVRGRGLFLGIELVRDRETLAPAAAQAAYVVERMREAGILLSTDGPLHNVIKIKPPLPFTASDAARLVRTLDRILAEDFVRAAS